MKQLVSLIFSLVSLGLAPAVWAGSISADQAAGVSFENNHEALFLTVFDSHEKFLNSNLDSPGGPADGPLYGNDGPPSGDLPGNGSDSPPDPPGYSPGDSQAPEPGSRFS